MDAKIVNLQNRESISESVSLEQLAGSPLKELMEFLLPRLAPILVGVKPSILLNLCNCLKLGKVDYYTAWKQCQQGIAGKTNLSFVELREKKKGVQVLFYDPNLLFSTLIQREHKNFLSQAGYVDCRTLGDYLKLLKRHFQGPSFPHEIGIFLGYPLKDVCGFIEKKDTPCPIKSPWRIFGDSKRSLQIMNRHRQAEGMITDLLSRGQNPLLCLDEIRMEVLKNGKMDMCDL